MSSKVSGGMTPATLRGEPFGHRFGVDALDLGVRAVGSVGFHAYDATRSRPSRALSAGDAGLSVTGVPVSSWR